MGQISMKIICLPGSLLIANQQTYLKKLTKTGYGAFAVSAATGAGGAWGWNTAAEAREGAIAQCEAGIASVMADIGPPAPSWIKKRGLDRCTITHESGPKQ